MIYLDNGAAEKPLKAAIITAENILLHTWGNPNSTHSFGMEAAQEIANARETISILLNCEPEEVHFCSCACEAASWAVRSMKTVCCDLQYSRTEHSCVIKAISQTRVPIPGRTHVGIIRMLANNETGEIYDLPNEKPENALVFTDATAAVGHIPVDFKALGCDYLCADATKFGGIPGAAFLIVRRGAPLVPLIYGNEERGGTPPTALIAAMAAALREKHSRMPEKVAKTAVMRDYMIRELLKIPGAHLNGAWTENGIKNRLPGNVNISFEGVDGTSLSLLLSQSGLMVSSGAACSSGNNEPSHVLLASGVPASLAKGAIRITLNEQNTMSECVEAAAMIAQTVAHLRSLAPAETEG